MSEETVVTEVTQEEGTSQVRPTGVNLKSKVVRKFMAKMPHLNFEVQDRHWVDPKTTEMYEVFYLGWCSHPSAANVAVIGRVEGDRVVFSENPRLHLRDHKSVSEVNRLKEVHKQQFVVFYTYREEDSELLKPLALKQYEVCALRKKTHHKRMKDIITAPPLKNQTEPYQHVSDD